VLVISFTKRETLPVKCYLYVPLEKYADTTDHKEVSPRDLMECVRRYFTLAFSLPEGTLHEIQAMKIRNDFGVY